MYEIGTDFDVLHYSYEIRGDYIMNNCRYVNINYTPYFCTIISSSFGDKENSSILEVIALVVQ